MKFNDLVEFLSDELDIDLIPDKDQTITIQVDDHLNIQLEMDDREKNFFFLAFVHDLPPGKFQENVFISALKFNNFPTRIGAFGFFKEENYLTFHRFLSNDTPKEEIINYLTEIIYVAENWKKAIDNGRSEPDDLPMSSDSGPMKPFGLKP